MSPGGHLTTTAAACAGAALVTASLPGFESLQLLAGLAAGGFLIDVDHFVDYVLFERQRDLRPQAFLRYYLEGAMRRTVLVLHSYELLALLGIVAWWTSLLPLQAYLVGALMHLALDITFNGDLTPRSIVLFYSFAYRLAHGFSASELLGPPVPRLVASGFWAAFFRGVIVPTPVAVPVTSRTADRVKVRGSDPLG